jgi:hypothetical protein
LIVNKKGKIVRKYLPKLGRGKLDDAGALNSALNFEPKKSFNYGRSFLLPIHGRVSYPKDFMVLSKAQ